MFCLVELKIRNLIMLNLPEPFRGEGSALHLQRKEDLLKSHTLNSISLHPCVPVVAETPESREAPS